MLVVKKSKMEKFLKLAKANSRKKTKVVFLTPYKDLEIDELEMASFPVLPEKEVFKALEGASKKDERKAVKRYVKDCYKGKLGRYAWIDYITAVSQKMLVIIILDDEDENYKLVNKMIESFLKKIGIPVYDHKTMKKYKLSKGKKKAVAKNVARFVKDYDWDNKKKVKWSENFKLDMLIGKLFDEYDRRGGKLNKKTRANYIKEILKKANKKDKKIIKKFFELGDFEDDKKAIMKKHKCDVETLMAFGAHIAAGRMYKAFSKEYEEMILNNLTREDSVYDTDALKALKESIRSIRKEIEADSKEEMKKNVAKVNNKRPSAAKNQLQKAVAAK